VGSGPAQAKSQAAQPRKKKLSHNFPIPKIFAPSREIADPGFLDCGGLTPLWIFPIEALYFHPKLRQAGALQDTIIATKRLG
jgi:hypothetical protein